MNSFMQGGIYSGIGQGLQNATSNILNLYQMQQRADLDKENSAIKKQNSEMYRRMMEYSLASQIERGGDLSKFMQPPSGTISGPAVLPGEDFLAGQDRAAEGVGLAMHGHTARHAPKQIAAAGAPAMEADPRFMQRFGADFLGLTE